MTIQDQGANPELLIQPATNHVFPLPIQDSGHFFTVQGDRLKAQAEVVAWMMRAHSQFDAARRRFEDVTYSPLNFARLKDQNENLPWDTHLPASIVYTDCLHLKKKAEQAARDVLRKLKALAGLKGRVIADIRDELLIVAQGEMVAQLNEFLDDCYLEVLQEVFSQGNRSRLTLGKFKASLNPARYLPDDPASTPSTLDADSAEWFTMRGLIRDIWLSYKFEAFREKTTMLFRACEYDIDSSLQRELKKHVQLRNCIQHHQRGFTKESLEVVGVQKFSLIADDGKVVHLEAGDKISFSAKEIIAFARVLTQLASTFDTHIRKRVRSLAWVPRRLGNEVLKSKG